jgi:hypothetical protein
MLMEMLSACLCEIIRVMYVILLLTNKHTPYAHSSVSVHERVNACYTCMHILLLTNKHSPYAQSTVKRIIVQINAYDSAT